MVEYSKWWSPHFVAVVIVKVKSSAYTVKFDQKVVNPCIRHSLDRKFFHLSMFCIKMSPH